MGYGYSKEDWKILHALKRKDIELERKANSKAHRVRSYRDYNKCPICGKFVMSNDGTTHKPYCKLTHCKRCGRFTGSENRHECRFNVR